MQRSQPPRKTLDCSEILSESDHNYRYSLYLDGDGRLCFADQNFKGEVMGVAEWNDALKKMWNIEQTDTVLDIYLLPENDL